MIKHCPTCDPHDFQDARYGVNMRVVNELHEDKGYRCTVCGKDIIKGVDKKKKDK